MCAKCGYEIDFSCPALQKKVLEKAIQADPTEPEVPRKQKTMSGNVPAYVTQPSEELKADRAARMKVFLEKLHKIGHKPVLLLAYPEYVDQFNDPVPPAVLPKSLALLRNKECDTMTEAQLADHCEKIKGRADVSQLVADKIEQETRAQHKSSKWRQIRVGRVTASNMHKVNTFDFDKPAVSTVKVVLLSYSV